MEDEEHEHEHVQVEAPVGSTIRRNDSVRTEASYKLLEENLTILDHCGQRVKSLSTIHLEYIIL